MKLCHHCGRELHFEGRPERTQDCPFCHSDLKVCLNCSFFDPGANNQCREPQAEWTSEKTKANFCEFFEFREVAGMSRPGAGGSRAAHEDARAAFDSLFRKKS